MLYPLIGVIDEWVFEKFRLDTELPFLILFLIGIILILANRRLNSVFESITKVKIGDVEFDRDVSLRLDKVEKIINRKGYNDKVLGLEKSVDDLHNNIDKKYTQLYKSSKYSLSKLDKVKHLEQENQINSNIAIAYEDLISVIDDLRRKEYNVSHRNLDNIKIHLDDLSKQFLK